MATAERPSQGLIGQGDPSPISIAGKAPSVLALHGFGGTPQEVALVAEVARDLGLAAHLPLLPGHGVSVGELKQTRFADWVAGAERALSDFAGTEGKVILAGLSLGSLLATQLALNHPGRVVGLALLANAFWLQAPFPSWALFAVDRLGLPDFSLKKLTSDIADPEARRTHLTLGAQPVHAAVDVWQAGRQLRSRLGEVRCPTLILHGSRDRVCPARNARRVEDLLGADDKRVRMFWRSRHIITRDVEKTLVREELHAFFRRLAQRPVEP